MEASVAVRQITDETHLDTLTDWMFGWWGAQEHKTREAVRCYMAHSLQAERLPQTYGLFLGDALIGMYQFTHEDLFARPDIYPWLANVYLAEAWRGAGYGRVLLASVRENARANLKADALYLYTEHSGLYEKFGWTCVGEIDTFLEPRMQRLYRLALR